MNVRSYSTETALLTLLFLTLFSPSAALETMQLCYLELFAGRSRSGEVSLYILTGHRQQSWKRFKKNLTRVVIAWCKAVIKAVLRRYFSHLQKKINPFHGYCVVRWCVKQRKLWPKVTVAKWTVQKEEQLYASWQRRARLRHLSLLL